MNNSSFNACYLLLLTAGSIAIAGCTSSLISAQAIDQPLSPSVSGSDHPCRELATTNPNFEMAIGTSCWFIVQASVRFGAVQPESSLGAPGNGTGLMVKANQAYEITVPSDQYWYDKTRRAPAPQGDKGGGITTLMGFTKRHADANWFRLMATVNHDDGKAKPLQCSPFIIYGFDGELSFYVNDASFYYGNNSGRIVVQIKRLNVTEPKVKLQLISEGCKALLL